MNNKEQIDREEYNRNSHIMENTPFNEIFEHFGIEGNPEESGQHWVIHNNRLLERERFMLNYGRAGRKRVVIDFDPDYFCFVVREIPVI